MKTYTGKVVSVKMPKTAVVEIVTQFTHPLYKKILKKSKKFHAHYTDMKISQGDEVEISQTRPISKLKRFRVVKLIKENLRK